VTRTMWLAAVPRCADGHAMEYVEADNAWVCLKDAGEVRGDVLARQLGFDTRMRFAPETP
jgi:hypothetical protein